MLISFDLLPELLGYSALFGTIYYLLYRRYIYSVVDPLFIFVFTTMFGSVLVIEAVSEISYITNYFGCQFSLFLGFALVQECTGNPALRSLQQPDTFYSDKQLLRCVTYTLLSIYLLSNLIVFYTKGFALLSDTPSIMKETNFREGFGIFRKISWAVGGVASAGLIFLYLSDSRRRDVGLLLLMMVLTSLEGSKGALLRYAIVFGLFLYHPAFRQRLDLLRRLRRYVPLGIVGIFGVFFIVLAKENSSGDEVLLAFMRRLLYGADAILYFYHPANIDYFSKFSLLDYPTYLINPILGFLRLAPYQEAFGNIMVENVVPPGIIVDVIVGPNTSFYTEGQIFFGYYGAFIYSFIIGILTSYARSLFFSLTHCSAFLLVYASTIFRFSDSLMIDVKTSITQMFDTVVLVLPVYAVVYLLVRRRLVIHRIRFSSPNNRLSQHS